MVQMFSLLRDRSYSSQEYDKYTDLCGLQTIPLWLQTSF